MGDRKMGKFVRGSGGIMVQNHGRRKKLRDANSSVSGIRQYSQRKPAREATSRRRAGLIRSAMRVAGTGLGFGEDQQMLKLFIQLRRLKAGLQTWSLPNGSDSGTGIDLKPIAVDGFGQFC